MSTRPVNTTRREFGGDDKKGKKVLRNRKMREKICLFEMDEFLLIVEFEYRDEGMIFGEVVLAGKTFCVR